MNRIIIYDYSPSLTEKFSGEDLIPRITKVEEIEAAYNNAIRANRVFCLWVDAPLMSLSDLKFEDINDNIPIIVHVFSVGDIFKFLSSVDTLKRLNIRIFLSSSNEENFSLIKLLSSLGVDSGLLFDAPHIDDERFLDIASYAFLGQVSHASIEPFDYIWRNIRSERNLDFQTLFFINPQKYIYVNDNMDYAFTRQALLENQFIGNLNLKKEIDFDIETTNKFKRYYSHFIDLDSCSKCPSFKVCDRSSQNKFIKCQDVFSTVFEYAEIRDSLERKNGNPKTICQL